VPHRVSAIRRLIEHVMTSGLSIGNGMPIKALKTLQQALSTTTNERM